MATITFVAPTPGTPPKYADIKPDGNFQLPITFTFTSGDGFTYNVYYSVYYALDPVPSSASNAFFVVTNPGSYIVPIPFPFKNSAYNQTFGIVLQLYTALLVPVLPIADSGLRFITRASNWMPFIPGPIKPSERLYWGGSVPVDYPPDKLVPSYPLKTWDGTSIDRLEP